MFSWLKPVTELDRLKKEHDEAVRAMREAQTAKEYAHSMVEYNAARIRRLQAAIDAEGDNV